MILAGLQGGKNGARQPGQGAKYCLKISQIAGSWLKVHGLRGYRELLWIFF
jgi:hypothetical protein